MSLELFRNAHRTGTSVQNSIHNIGPSSPISKRDLSVNRPLPGIFGGLAGHLPDFSGPDGREMELPPLSLGPEAPAARRLECRSAARRRQRNAQRSPLPPADPQRRSGRPTAAVPPAAGS